MNIDDYPQPRPMLFVNEMESWLLDPSMIPFALTTPPYAPGSSLGATPAGAHKPPPMLVSPPVVRSRTTRVVRLRGLRAFLQTLHLIRP
ncbi:MAG: hypothetical protein QOE51_1489 [Actinoplanes sp.]|jgi:hypothetical protein|nr:hypothetical protein [Actinoplanes sp.]